MILYWTPRSSRLEVFCKKGVLRNFTTFTEKHLCQSLFFNKVASLRPATLLKKRLWHRCFPVNLVKFLRQPFSIKHLWWLLLDTRSQGLSKRKLCQYYENPTSIYLFKFNQRSTWKKCKICSNSTIKKKNTRTAPMILLWCLCNWLLVFPLLNLNKKYQLCLSHVCLIKSRETVLP